MKVFVRSSNLAGERPVVLAFYPDDSNVGNDAHGEGVTILTLPMEAIEKGEHSGLPSLVKDWRARAKSIPIHAEAKRRIEEAFTIEDQVNALREMIEMIMEHGLDSERWPVAARERKIAIDEKWSYIDEVKERARAHSPNVLINPDSDKLWPRRLTKKS